MTQLLLVHGKQHYWGTVIPVAPRNRSDRSPFFAPQAANNEASTTLPTTSPPPKIREPLTVQYPRAPPHPFCVHRANAGTPARRSSTRCVNHAPLARCNKSSQCILRRGRGEWRAWPKSTSPLRLSVSSWLMRTNSVFYATHSISPRLPVAPEPPRPFRLHCWISRIRRPMVLSLADRCLQ